VEDVPARPNETKDEPVKIPLDPEEALRALLAVKLDDDAAVERQNSDEPTTD
jgi:hypothetical protein